jgi:HK97 gp10 family phage protein
MANIEVKGTDAVLKEIEKKFGNKHMRRLSDRALKKAAEMFLTELKRAIGAVPGKYRTGATEAEAELAGPKTGKNGERYYVVQWRGKDNRYRLIHINEFGTVKNPNPPLKGAIAKTIKNIEKRYFKTIKRELEKGAA